jgi:hypothetical protein
LIPGIGNRADYLKQPWQEFAHDHQLDRGNAQDPKAF